MHLGDLLLAFFLLGLLALMASTVSYGVTLWLQRRLRSAPVMNTVAMPLAMLSGVMLPMIYAPQWLRNIAAFNPFAWAVDGIRALFDGGQTGDFVVWKAIGLTALLAVLAGLWSARMFTKSVR